LLGGDVVCVVLLLSFSSHAETVSNTNTGKYREIRGVEIKKISPKAA
jgi:hypothetical protein